MCCWLGACSGLERSSPGALPITGGGQSGQGTGGDVVAGGDGGAATGSPGGMSGTDAGADVPPPLSALGVACAQDGDCDSGFCVDGVCCVSRCDGICQTCNPTGSPGQCLPAEVGTDPRNDCPDELAGSCARDGECDGAGQCRRYPFGTICKPATCVGATLTAAARCGGNGCTVVDGQPCDPYQCGPAGVCLTSCTADGDCLAPSTCNAGLCGKKPIGDKCTADMDCNSGHCAQNICCGTACAALCTSCALTGSEGRCTMVPPDQDPLNQCPRQDPATCGLDGFCDGTGACRNYAAGTVCGAATCNGNMLTAAATCDGQKVCGGPMITSCGNYTCDMTAGRCRALCAADTDCVSPSICSKGVCGGVLARYYGDTTLTNLLLTRTEPQINFNWGEGAPAPGLPADMFSVRFTATVTPRFSETYTLYLLVDDGARLWVNDVQIINDWNTHAPQEDMGTIALPANQPATIRVEYFEQMGGAEIVMSWSSPSEPKAVVPVDRLTPQ